MEETPGENLQHDESESNLKLRLILTLNYTVP